MLHVAAPEENQSRLEFRLVGDECHIRLHRLTRPVQIPCRSFWQVIDSAYLCRTRTNNIKTLYLLFTYCYDISVILSEAKDLCIPAAKRKFTGPSFREGLETRIEGRLQSPRANCTTIAAISSTA